MPVDSLLCLLLGLSFNSAGVHNELILHDNGHIANSQLWLIRLNQTQLDLVILLQQLLVLSLPLGLLFLILGQKHRQHYPLILIILAYFLIVILIPYLIP